MEIEAKTLEEGFFLLGSYVAFESDSNIVIDALIGTSEAPVAIDNIIGGIRAKLQNFRCVEISYVKQDGNRPAHLLA